MSMRMMLMSGNRLDWENIKLDAPVWLAFLLGAGGALWYGSAKDVKAVTASAFAFGLVSAELVWVSREIYYEDNKKQKMREAGQHFKELFNPLVEAAKAIGWVLTLPGKGLKKRYLVTE